MPTTFNNTNGAFTSGKTKRIAIAIAASLAGVSLTTIISGMCIHDSFFKRYERPDYRLYPGLYSYDRIKDTLKRETFKIKSEDAMLQAYYYPTKAPKGLAVLAHGFHAGSDDYLPLIEAIVNRGYCVLTYDVTGVYSSGGDSMVGMCQSLIDLDNVLNYANSDLTFKSMPKVVIGHSWGGYAAASVLAIHKEVKAAVLYAPMNDGSKVMLEKAEQYAGKLVHPTGSIIETYQEVLFGDYVKYNGIVGINSGKIPVLIAQGIDDTTITPHGQSITAHLERITNPNVSYYWGRGSQGTHTGIWHSKESEEYQREIKSLINLNKFRLNRELTDGERARIYASINHRLYSEVNTELIDLTVKTFDKGLGI